MFLSRATFSSIMKKHTYFPYRELTEWTESGKNTESSDPSSVEEAKAHIDGLSEEDLEMLAEPTWSSLLASLAKRRYRTAKHILVMDMQNKNALEKARLKALRAEGEQMKHTAFAKMRPSEYDQPSEPSIRNVQYWEDNFSRISSKVQSHVERLKDPKTLGAPLIRNQDLVRVLYTRDTELIIPIENKEPFDSLEMVGDAVLYHSFCHVLMTKYPFITSQLIGKVRDKLVSNGQLLPWCVAYDLPYARQMEQRGGNKAISDIFEAYAGGLFRDDPDMTRIYNWCSEILDYAIVTFIYKDLSDVGLILKNSASSDKLKESINDLLRIIEPFTKERIGMLKISEDDFTKAIIHQLATSDFEL